MEDYKKKYKDVLAKAREIHRNEDEKRFDIEWLFPELKESEDERIKKELIDYFINDDKYSVIKSPKYKELVALFEKQKDIDSKEYVFRPLAGCDINTAAIQAVEQQKLGNKIVLAFNGAYISVEEKTADDIVNEYYSWLEKQGKSSDQIHYWTEEEIEPIISDYLRGAEHYGGMIGRLRCLKPKSLKKQDNSSVKWQKNTPYNKPAIKHSVLMKTTQGIAEGEWQGEDWFQYRWSWTLKESNVLAWMELSDLDEQGEQKPILDFKAKDWYVSKVDGKLHNIYHSVDKIEQKPTSDTRYEVGAGGSLSVNGKPFDYEKATITQKDFAPKQEPKFKTGNWYQCTKDFFGKGVTFDKNTAYYCAKEGCLQDEYGCHIAIVKDLYDNFKLWTIQDARAGDILTTGKSVFIYAKVLYIKQAYAYCGVDKFGVFKDNCLENNWTNSLDDIHPATKEQRDTLMKAMADAGYKWDADKKELKKIDDEIEIPFGAKDSELQEETYYIPKGFHAEIDDDKVVIKKGEKSAAWNNEDEEKLQDCIGAILDANYYLYDKQEMEAWLKRIKDRIGG